MSSNAIKIPEQIEKFSLETSSSLGLIRASPLNNGIDEKKSDCGYEKKITKLLVKTRICIQKCLAVYQYLYFSDKFFENDKFSLIRRAAFMRPATFKFSLKLKFRLLKTSTVP